MKDGCPFCEYDGPSRILADYGEVFVIEPINPVAPGHVLVIPRAHAESFCADEWLVTTAFLASVFAVSVQWARTHEAEGWNIISSAGKAATQTVKHLHVHVVPRREGDGLKLPWSA